MKKERILYVSPHEKRVRRHYLALGLILGFLAAMAWCIGYSQFSNCEHTCIEREAGECVGWES